MRAKAAIVFGLLVVGVLVLLFIPTQALDLDLHNRRADLLLRLERGESTLDRALARLAPQGLAPREAFAEQDRQLREALAAYASLIQETPDQYGQAVRGPFGVYRQALETKLTLFQRIADQTSKVGAGLDALAQAVEGMRAISGPLGAQLDGLQRDLLHHLLAPHPGEAHLIRERLDGLGRQLGPTGEDSTQANQVLGQMREQLRVARETRELKDIYLGTPGAERLREVYAAHSQVYAVGTAHAKRYSVILLGLVAALFIALGYLVRRLSSARGRAERALGQLRDAVESIPEGFALFGTDGRLVLHNRRYLEFYPWLAGRIGPDSHLDAILAHNQDRGVQRIPVVAGETERRPPGLPCQQGPVTLERVGDGRWYLATDSCTSSGELACVRVDITDSKRAEMELRKLHRALEQSPATVVITDTEGRIEYVNPKFEEMTGYTAAEVLGQNPRILKSGDKSSEEYKDLWETISAGKVWRGQFHNRHKDGSIFWESASISPVRDDQGVITHFIAVKEDITARKRAEDQLRINATVFETITEGIVVTDGENRIKTVNPAFTRITGYEAEEVIGRDPRVLRSGRHDQAFYAAMWDKLLATGYWTGELWNRRKDGSVYPAWLSLAAIRDEKGVIQEYVGIFSDITRRKRDEEQIRRQANYDALTDLPNRTLLMDRMVRALTAARREGARIGLLFVDLDRFKEVNDSLGHVQGDELLQRVAERLLDCVRESDTVARYGGDEFVIVLEPIHQANDAAEVAKKVITAVGRPYYLLGREVGIGASVGISLYPADALDADMLLRHADMAMYEAKDLGRNTYRFYTPGMNEQVQERMELAGDLRQALERNQLSLDYQPILRLDDGDLIGVEALLRWRHPQRGLIEPGLFIPVAEDTGMIGVLGRWLLAKACAQGAAWQDAGLDLQIHINLSSRQLTLGLAVEEVRDVLIESGLPPDRLVLEVREDLILEDRPATREWLSQVRALGVVLAIDNFGSGYSSLNYLKRFPVDSVKIDNSFVRELPSDPATVAVVQAILALARGRGLRVVAEGVETPPQLDLLRRIGCEEIQGYLLSRPVPAEDIPPLARRVLLPAPPSDG